MGDWIQDPAGKEAIWKDARHVPATFEVDVKGQGRNKSKKLAITTAQGNWFSSHEDWGFLVLPFRDVPVADTLFKNAQWARTSWSAMHGWPGLFASTHEPVKGNIAPRYVSDLGVASIAKAPVNERRIFAPYAAFPLALVDHSLFASWLKSMLKQPGMYGPNGIGESFAADGSHAPILTWDGKALPIIAWMGGVSNELRSYLQRDGLYDTFIAQVRRDYRRFDGVKLSDSELSLSPPP